MTVTDVEMPLPKQLLRPITTGANRTMNQSEFPPKGSFSIVFTPQPRLHVAVNKGGLACGRKDCDNSYCNGEIIFRSHLKTTIYARLIMVSITQLVD